MDDLLSQLNSLSNLSILVTMRGTEWPTGITWSKPLFPVLQPLQLDDSMQILTNAAAHENVTVTTSDEHICKLIQEVKGVPLTATLLGHLLRDGVETGESLWNRWQDEHTSMIKTDDNDRLYSLDVSIQLSMNCWYMNKVPDAKELLVYVDQRTQIPRIRLLSPIQHFCQAKFRLSSELKVAITVFYANFIIAHNGYTIADNHVIVPPELANVEILLCMALQSNPSEIILKASIDYTNWIWYIGTQSKEGVILLATERATSTQILADCLCSAGKLFSHGNDLNQAEKSFKQAIELHQQARDVLGEANDLKNLGEVQMCRDELEEAEKSFKHAIELHQQAQDVLGEANGLQNLGEVQMCQDELEEAEKSFKHAIELHQQAHNVLGEANDYHVLAELRIKQHQFNAAETCLNRAFLLHKQAQDASGERWDLQLLDQLHELQKE